MSHSCAKSLFRLRVHRAYNVGMKLSLMSGRRGCVAAGIVLIFTILGLSGCNRQSENHGDVWAEVDGQTITRDQVERVYKSRASQGSDDTSNPDQVLSLKLSILNELINNQILIEHASYSRISVSEAEIDTRIAELQSPYAKDEFEKKLRDQGMTPEDLRQQVRENLVINKLINKEINSRIAVSDAEVAQYYERNKASFDVPETAFHLAQIAVTPVADPETRNLKNDDAKTPQAAERKIRALYAELQHGTDFAKVAQEYSEDPRTASMGGDMGFITVSSVNANPILRQVVPTLQVGQYSPIFRAQDGFHIMKLLDKEEKGLHPLTDPEVQSSIRQALTNIKEQLLKQAYIEDLRNKAKVVNYLASEIVEGKAH
jgi:peptidyl-prolyl cis-trans isomerase SurA